MKRTLISMALAASVLCGCARIGAWIDSKTNSVPPIVIGPTTTTTQPTVAQACGCSEERADYSASPSEKFFSNNPDVRVLLNWDRPGGDCTWMDADMIGSHLVVADGQATFTCYEIAPGVRIHIVGMCQPSSQSTLVEMKSGVAVPVSGDTLRIVVESRRSK